MVPILHHFLRHFASISDFLRSFQSNGEILYDWLIEIWFAICLNPIRLRRKLFEYVRELSAFALLQISQWMYVFQM